VSVARLLLCPDATEALTRLGNAVRAYGADASDDEPCCLRLAEARALLEVVEELRHWVSKSIWDQTSIRRSEDGQTCVIGSVTPSAQCQTEAQARRARVHYIAQELFIRRNLSPSDAVAQAESICLYLDHVRRAEVTHG
jgi:hypothetical protein